MVKFHNWSRRLMDTAGDGKGGGGAGNGGDPNKDLESLKTQNAELLKRLEALEGKNKPAPETKPDPAADDLAAKAAKERLASEQARANEKQLESAIRFNLGAKEWLKTNASLLPKTVEGIFAAAEKENYENPIKRDAAIKAGIVSEFFQVQGNLDLLTGSQKTLLEEFFKLTKTGKEDKAQSVYDSVFEPTFEMLKRIKKAEQLSQGHSTPSDIEAAYKERLIKGSRKHYLGEKQ